MNIVVKPQKLASSKSDSAVELSCLLDDIVSEFFGDLVDRKVKVSVPEKDITNSISFHQRSLEVVRQDFESSLKRLLINRCHGNNLERDTNLLFLDYLQNLNREAKLQISGLSIPYLNNFFHSDDVHSLLDNIREVFLQPNPKPEDSLVPIYEVIADAIHEVINSIPILLFIKQDRIVDLFEKELIDILVRLNRTRLVWNPTISQASLKNSLLSLYKQIFKADDYIWFPIKPLVTSPLEDNLIKDLYSRDDSSAIKLAQQIVKNDGIILVSGYRGVGKSTFINTVLEKHVPEVELNQYEDTLVKVLPININIAKYTDINYALRLCIRRINRVLEENLEIPLHKEEKSLIFQANLRSTFHVTMTRGEIFSHANQIKTALGFDPGKVFSNLIAGSGISFLPSVNFTNSRDWEQKLDHSISILDYDEDRAEEDIIKFIYLLSRPRNWGTKKVKIKPVFVFDELDKLEDEKSIELICKLKNLFLTQNSVFILVTCKDFYYYLYQERKKEDSILGSYFSSIVSIPIFSSKNTASLLQKLIIKPSEIEGGNEETKKESDFIQLLARYLTYKSTGLPREIIRQLRDLQCWTMGSLQPYLTDRNFEINAMNVFADIQMGIESIENAGNWSSSPFAENSKNLDQLWIDDSRKEQIRRGLYILVDELIMKGELDSSSIIVKKIHTDNFKSLSEPEFWSLFNRLGLLLSNISGTKEHKAYFEFKQPKGEGAFLIKVLPDFYAVTKIQQVGDVTKLGLQEIPKEKSLEIANEWLSKGNITALRHAIFYLQSSEKPLPVEVQEKLFDVLSQPFYGDSRIDAGQYITHHTLYDLWKKDPSSVLWISNENDEQVLQQVYSLTMRDLQEEEYAFSIQMTRLLLKNPNISDKFKENIIAKLVDISNQNLISSDIVRECLAAFNHTSDLPENVVDSLIRICKLANTDLISLIFEQKKEGISLDTIIQILKSEEVSSLEEHWKQAILEAGKNRKLLAAILLVFETSSDLLPSIIKDWLQKTSPTDEDVNVLLEVNKKNIKLLRILLQIAPSEEGLLQHVVGLIKEAAVTQGQGSNVKEKPKEIDKGYSNPKILNYVLGITALVITYMLPVDIPKETNISTDILFWVKTGQIVYMASLAFGLFMVIGQSFRIGISAIGFGLILLLVVIWFSNFPITLGGQIITFVCLLFVYLLPKTVQAIIRMILKAVEP